MYIVTTLALDSLLIASLWRGRVGMHVVYDIGAHHSCEDMHLLHLHMDRVHVCLERWIVTRSNY